MTKKISTILFDFDGTIFDTNELIFRTFEHVLETHYPGKYRRKDILPFLGPTLEQTFGLIDLKKADQLVGEYREWNAAHHDELATEFDGVSETLRLLKAEGYKLGVVSTKKNHMLWKGLELMEAGDVFDVVIGLDDVLKPKPDPEPILLALERLNVDREEALMVGDNYHDIVGGKNAGVKTVGVAWTAKGEDFLQQYNPDFMLQHISDILPIVKGEGN